MLDNEIYRTGQEVGEGWYICTKCSNADEQPPTDVPQGKKKVLPKCPKCGETTWVNVKA